MDDSDQHTGRIIAGISIGMLYSAIPTYMSELAPPAIRGWIVGFHAISLSIGYFVSSAIVGTI
jgi:MFS family permease